MSLKKQLPCEDCDTEKNRLELRGYRVLGCKPAATASMCDIEYEEITPAQADPVVAKAKKGVKAKKDVKELAAPAEPAWMAIARRELGVKELPGNATNPRIAEYNASTTYGAKDDETSWCSSFVNWCVAGAKIAGTGNVAARSWMTWGQSLHAPRPGCVTVLWRDSPQSWKGHVAFFVKADPHNANRIILLGGNQGDSVCEAAFDKSRVLAFRWPSVTP